ncbi:SLIT-ROBO Rho GTPase-activating protein 1 [Larimichthys crocea]|uniref:SLIT-ROBO Rho GTPase-activating protein 1 n=1 Tax=Larimichthys crocea TaxID=215358 RepID=A0A6G0IY35_LARCR|nr:SLIT-ROBO Rho GTPase-activating protein 1 [Larimichthys crocea]
MSTPRFKKDKEIIADYESQVKEIRAQLVEQQKCLDQQTEMRVQLLQDLQDFFRKKAEIEMEYSRNLEKLAERFMAKTRSTKDHQQYKKDQNLLSPVNCWYLLLNQVRRESKDHATLSDIYLNNVIMRFMQISEDSTRLLKKSKEIAFQLQEDLMKVLNELYTVMKTYHMYHSESISAESKLKEAEKQEEKQIGRGDPVFSIRMEDKYQRRSSVKKIEKMKEKRQAKYSENKLKSIKARNEYLLTLEASNSSVFKYYIHDLSDLIDCCDLGYHASLNRALRTYLSAEYNLETSRHEGLDIIENAVDSLDPRSDRQRFMEMYPTAFCPPAKFEFQAHMGDEVCQISVQPPVNGELILRFQQLQSRLATLKIENEEIKKTSEATLTTIQDMVTIEDYDVSECFHHSRSTESVKSTVSETYLSKPSIAKRRANQQETEQFYFMIAVLKAGALAGTQGHCVITLNSPQKFREFLEGSNLISKLQAKHDLLKRTLGEGLQHQGIFRVSGSQLEVNDIKNSFERGNDPLTDDENNHDINSVAGVLKLYFRGLENPLFPKERFNDLLACIRIENLYERALYIRKILLTIPRSVLIVMRYLFAFLNHLSQYSDENMMDPYNLAICFGPTLMPTPDSQDQVSCQAHVNEIIKTIIIHHETIFPDAKELDGPIYEKCMAGGDYCESPYSEHGALEEVENEAGTETHTSEDEAETESLSVTQENLNGLSSGVYMSRPKAVAFFCFGHSGRSFHSVMDASKGKGDQGMQNPGGQMDRPVSFHFLESMLPKVVKRRVHALKRLQVQCANIEAKFYEEVHELERKYAALYQPLFEKRRDIVTGTVEPTDEECEWHSDREEEEELAEEVKEKAAIEDAKKEEAVPEEDPKGIPEFWLTIFKSVDMLSDMLQEHDEPILKHLKDIQVKFSEPGQPMSFTLEFHFEPNGYFNMQCSLNCQIDWHKGKDVTVKTIKKKQKHKGRGTVRTVTKQVPNDSFFNFFNPVKASPDGEMDEDSEFTLATDFEIGHFFRERIVPRAVLYFTGEALEDDESFEEEELDEGDEEEQDEEGDDDDDEGDFDPKVNMNKD